MTNSNIYHLFPLTNIYQQPTVMCYERSYPMITQGKCWSWREMHIWRSGGIKKLDVLGYRKKASFAGMWWQSGREVEEGSQVYTQGPNAVRLEGQWKAIRKAKYCDLIFFLALLSFSLLCRHWIVVGQEWKQAEFFLPSVLRQCPYSCVPQFWLHVVIFVFSRWTWVI